MTAEPNEPEPHDEIRKLVRRLTEWQRASGLSPSGSSCVASTGEATAAIADLKGKLDHLGVRYHWSESAKEYKLDSEEPFDRSIDQQSSES